MKPPLSDTLVICDMDNTLLTAKGGHPRLQPRGHPAVHRHGGCSRWQRAARRVDPRGAGDIRLSLPAISCNGALLYDFSAESVLHRSTLNREAGDDGHP